MKGSYILVLKVDQPIVGLRIGRLGCFDFAPGFYLYVGSAFGSGGLEARLAYHRRRQKARPHWHIDYLRAAARLYEAWTVSSPERLECRWCGALGQSPALRIPVLHFGSRDTGCPAHLFYTPSAPGSDLLTRIILGEPLHRQPVDMCIEIHRFDE